ncbi:MAG TPA: carboxypeptidase-like regulatory domain-containing protein, partial [Terriglobales bacterium]|nr:carboxypeptidase-like regulatory domain-containing protein [Terriglobales bacterium]
MKLKTAFLTLIAFIAVVFAVPALAQTSGLGTVKGTVRDGQGNVIPDAQVIWHNNETGREYKLKTNKKGEYFSLGIEPSHDYKITLVKDGKELFHQDKF